MKLVKLSSYYFPEHISSSHLTADIEHKLADEGIFTEIFCPTPTRGITEEVREKYKKIKYEEFPGKKVTVHRFPMFREGKNTALRAVRYLLVNYFQYRSCLKSENADIVTCGSTPPTQGIFAGAAARKLTRKYGKKVPFLYWLQDVFPESLVTTGIAGENSILYKLGKKIEAAAYERADHIIVISEEMKKNLLAKGVPEDKLSVLRNWVDTDSVRPVPYRENKLAEELGISDGKFRIVYAGNIGKAQGVGTLLEAAAALENDEDTEFLIFGDGAEREQLLKQYGKYRNIRFFPLQPLERVSEVYSLGDCCAVTCRKGIEAVGVPSKTWSIMACGKPLLVSVDKCELTDFVASNNIGVCCCAGDADELAEKICYLKGHRPEAENMGENARLCAVEYVGRDKAVQKFKDIVCDLVETARV